MILAHGLCNTTWWFCGTFYYISRHQHSCQDKEKTKEKEVKESSGTRLERLAKGAFVKVGSMAWDVWIHASSHGFLVCGYDIEGFYGCIEMVFVE